MVSTTKEKTILFFDKLLIFPEMKNHGPLSKNAVLGLQAYILGMIIITRIADISVLFSYWTIFMAVGATATLIFQVSGRRNAEGVIFAGMLLTMAITFYFIHQLGGIANSAGLILAGPVIVITSLILERKGWTILLMAIYLAAVALILILPGKQEISFHITPEQNALYFTLNTIFFGIFLLFPATRLIDEIAENEALNERKQDERIFLLRAKSKLYGDIIRHVEGMLKGIIDFSSSHVNGNAGKVMEKVIHDAGAMKQDLLLKKALAELESRSTRIKKVQSDFVRFSRHVADELSVRAKKSNIKILYQSQINQFNLDFDPDIVKRIMSYVVADAIRRTDANGNLSITIGREQENEWMDLLAISISDKGKPLEESLLELVSQPDYEHVNEMAAAYGDTAPGLMMAGELARILGGRINVRTNDRKGTIFRIFLPVHNASRFVGFEELMRSLRAAPGDIPLNGRDKTKGPITEMAHGDIQPLLG